MQLASADSKIAGKNGPWHQRVPCARHRAWIYLFKALETFAMFTFFYFEFIRFFDKLKTTRRSANATVTFTLAFTLALARSACRHCILIAKYLERLVSKRDRLMQNNDVISFYHPAASHKTLSNNRHLSRSSKRGKNKQNTLLGALPQEIACQQQTSNSFLNMLYSAHIRQNSFKDHDLTTL